MAESPPHTLAGDLWWSGRPLLAPRIGWSGKRRPRYGSALGVGLGRCVGGPGHAPWFLPLGPVQLLLDRRLRETQLEQCLLGCDDHVRVAAQVGDRVVCAEPQVREHW